ncbi:glycoside hydrolase family 2 protein [Spirochaeta dissipatitropha]
MKVHSLSLNGTGWSLQSPALSQTINAAVPGSLFTAVLDAGILPDPFYGKNDLQYAELAEQGCSFTRKFNYDLPETQKHTDLNHFLVLSSVDTICRVILNGQECAALSNMHREHRIDITRVLKNGANTLELHFSSASDFYRKKNSESPLWNAHHSLQGVGHLRKSYFMSGWDWGPTLPDMGPAGSIEIETCAGAALQDVHLRQVHSKDTAVLHFDFTMDRNTFSDDQIIITVYKPGGKKLQTIEQRIHTDRGRLSFLVMNPRLWWPNGMGEQVLYRAEIEHRNSFGSSRMEMKFGIRTISLVTEPDKWGSSFYFRINGRDIFARGGNYVPQDNLITRINGDRITELLEDCRRANHNMIRIWGGGIYLDDFFYEECTRLGLLVWQDFMLACSAHELTEEFTFEFLKETEYQVRRLRNHSSLALWCGNNEMEAAYDHWDIPKTEKLTQHYLSLFEIRIPEIVHALDPDRQYWPSSPSSYGGIIQAQSPNHGDVHDWQVWHGRQPFSWFSTQFHRFLSEFGMQSFPSMDTVRKFADITEQQLHSDVMDHHQKNDAGNELIQHYTREYIGEPGQFPHLVYASQLMQAEGIGEAIRHFRMNSPRCMGTIYWQLNDSWPGPSWSGIDYYGLWKPLHYATRSIFAPVILDCSISGRKINTVLLSDSAVKDMYSVVLSCIHSSGKLLESFEFKGLEIDGSGMNTIRLQAVKLPKGFNIDNSCIHMQLFRKGKLEWSSSKFFCNPRQFKWETPRYELKINRNLKGIPQLSVKAQNLICRAWIEIDGKPLPNGEANFETLSPIHEITALMPEQTDEKSRIQLLSLNDLVLQSTGH